jgi:hypothetical protein
MGVADEKLQPALPSSDLLPDLVAIATLCCDFDPAMRPDFVMVAAELEKVVKRMQVCVKTQGRSKHSHDHTDTLTHSGLGLKRYVCVCLVLLGVYCCTCCWGCLVETDRDKGRESSWQRTGLQGRDTCLFVCASSLQHLSRVQCHSHAG